VLIKKQFFCFFSLASLTVLGPILVVLSGLSIVRHPFYIDSPVSVSWFSLRTPSRTMTSFRRKAVVCKDLGKRFSNGFSPPVSGCLLRPPRRLRRHLTILAALAVRSFHLPQPDKRLAAKPRAFWSVLPDFSEYPLLLFFCQHGQREFCLFPPGRERPCLLTCRVWGRLRATRDSAPRVFFSRAFFSSGSPCLWFLISASPRRENFPGLYSEACDGRRFL